MDYKTKYTQTYNATFLKQSAFFKKELIAAKEQQLTYNYTSNTLLKLEYKHRFKL